MKKTGQFLKETRESKGLTLAEVSSQLKINSKILQAIEDGDMVRLPAKTFLRGFVQTYTKYLQLDMKQVMDLFNEEQGVTHPDMITKDVTGEQSPASTQAAPVLSHGHMRAVTRDLVQPEAPKLSIDPRVWSRYQKIGLTSLIVFLLLVIGLVMKTVERYQREKVNANQQLDVTNTSNTSTSEDFTDTSETSPEPKVETLENDLKPTTNPAEVASSGVKNEINNTTTSVAEVAKPLTTVEQKTPEIVAKAVPVINEEQKINHKEVKNTEVATGANIIPIEMSNKIKEPVKAPTSVVPSVTTSPSPTTNVVIKPNTNTTQNNLKPETKLELKEVSNNLVISNTTKTTANGTAVSNLNKAVVQTNPPVVAKPITSLPTSVVPNTVAPLAITSASDNKVELAASQVVIIEAKDNVTVEYVLDGGERKKLNLLKDRVHTFKASKSVLISTSDGGSVSVIHNGKDRGLIGTKNQAAQVVYP